MTIVDLSAAADSLLAGKVPALALADIERTVDAVEDRLRAGARGAGSGVPDKDLTAALAAMNGRRLFATAVRAGQAFLPFAPESAPLRRRYVQALIDSGALDLAQEQIQRALGFTSCPPDERLELQGLTGRLLKQRYVQDMERLRSADSRLLHEAIDSYLAPYEEWPEAYWHGINAVALLRRAQLDGMPHPGKNARAEQIAGDLVALLTPRYGQGLNAWGVGTIAEAHLALRAGDLAELWMYRYVSAPDITPFHLGSTLRQMRQVWRLSQTSAGSGALVAMLDHALATADHMAMLDLAATPQEAVAGAALEKKLGVEGFVGYETMARAVANCVAIARIETTTACGKGTGFLIRGRQLSRRLPDAPVLLTNAHVLSDDRAGPPVPGALLPQEARVRFEVANRQSRSYQPLAVDRVLWSSPPGELGRPPPDIASGCDVTIVTLMGLPDDAPCLETVRTTPRLTGTSRAYVVGHPDGDALQFSVHDSELLDVDDAGTLVHYRTPTIGGNSGSPVFNNEWKVFAIHHAGMDAMPRFRVDGTYPANEGIPLGRIAQAIERAAS